MPGVHRRPDSGSPGKSGRFVAVLAGLVIGVPAVVAGLIWFFATATALKLSAVLLILGTAGLVRALVQGELAMVWVSMSVVIGSGWQVISDVTHQPGGGLASYLVRGVALVCCGVASVLLFKADDLGLGRVWKAVRARLASGPGDDGPARPE